jgi:hypothetical protein
MRARSGTFNRVTDLKTLGMRGGAQVREAIFLNPSPRGGEGRS